MGKWFHLEWTVPNNVKNEKSRTPAQVPVKITAVLSLHLSHKKSKLRLILRKNEQPKAIENCEKPRKKSWKVFES